MTQALKNETPAEEVLAYTLHGNRYLNISNRCNLYCHFCPRMENDWNVKGYELNMRGDPNAEALLKAMGSPTDYEEIVFCGLGEPTLCLDTVLTVAREVHRLGGKTRLNTNGLANLYHKRDITPELASHIDAISVSLNAQDEETYNRHCLPRQPGAYQALLDFVVCAKRHVPEISLTAVDGLPGVDIEACRRIAENLGVGFRRRVLHEVG